MASDKVDRYLHDERINEMPAFQLAPQKPVTPPSASSKDKDKLTWYIISSSFAASTGGFLYGYNLVAAGGISIMNDFLRAFYPAILDHKQSGSHGNYCKYDNQAFQLFSSSLCLAALFATFLASPVTRKYGHTTTMIGAGIFYMLGSVMGAAALNLTMVYLSRVLMGCGIGFSNQAIPLYLSEIAPLKHRGKLLLFFSLELAFGLFIANLTNFLSNQRHPWGWRVSFAVCIVPALILTITGMIIVDSPYTLIAQGRHEHAQIVLQKLRQTDDVHDELNELIKGRAILEAEESKKVKPKGQLWSLFSSHHRPHLIIAIAMPFFQQMSGFDAILFYGPSVFGAAGFKDGAALYSTLITGFFAFISTLIAAYIVDHVGRRKILLYCTVAMFISMVVVATILGTQLRGTVETLSHVAGIIEVVVLCIVVLAYKASWGPMAWLIPSEIFPQEIRSTGQSLVVSLNMLIKFSVAQSFLSMLCTFKFGIFLFFAGWLVVMGIFTYFLIPETRGIQIDSMKTLWDQHWYWKRFTLVDHVTSPMAPEKQAEVV
ncbi:hypothetical protein GOP47_0003982 [Adiantum capillus-veneris]|uniref:Major facilitator superfamily (MFS) profile domain-containing protein n=1 Tax=Adiantum capillus-veneris TaxID=13818 RepID=A0A9D4ZMF3_ADICA|nr:hypothetical protein GOP47_0003982 [Adiantum capillus-veneris]